MSDHWTTEELPGIDWSDVDQDTTTSVAAHLRAQGIHGGTPIHTVRPPEEYL